MGLKIHRRAYRWNFLCLLLTPSLGWMLEGRPLGNRNGIRHLSHRSWRPDLVVFNCVLRIGVKPVMRFALASLRSFSQINGACCVQRSLSWVDAADCWSTGLHGQWKTGFCDMKPFLQKRLREFGIRWGNPLDWYVQRIAVRTEWQSSHSNGDVTFPKIQGEPLVWRQQVVRGETNLT